MKFGLNLMRRLYSGIRLTSPEGVVAEIFITRIQGNYARLSIKTHNEIYISRIGADGIAQMDGVGGTTIEQDRQTFFNYREITD